MLCLQAASASASSTLLSGYGGPGQGNQAIIGATLVGGGSGGGSGSGSTGSQAAGSAPASIALPQASAGKGGSTRRRAHPARRAGKPSAPSATTGSTDAQRRAPAAARSGGGGTLGLTSAEVLYVILAFFVLAATAVLTARLTGRRGRAGGTR